MPTQEMPMHFVNRTEWEAKPSMTEIPAIEHPVKYVRFSYTEGIRKCETNKKCTKRVRKIQEHDMKELKLPDIQPNFMVAGDGYVYEGRGWRLQPPGIPERPDLDGKFIEFSFIGNFSKKCPSNEMLFRANQAIKIGINLKFLDPEYEILKLGDLQYTNLGADEPRFD